MTGKTLRRAWAALALALAVLVALGPTTALAEDVEDRSFYAVGSAATTYFDQNQMSEDDESWKDEHYRSVDVGDAGAMVGYFDKDVISELISSIPGVGATFALLSDSSMVRDYNVFDQAEGLGQYVRYGRALNELGLDKGKTLMSLFETLGGGIMTLFWVVSVAVSTVFKGIVRVVCLLNPFAVMGAALASIQQAVPGIGQEGTLADGLSRLSVLLKPVYGSAHLVGFVVLTASLVFAVVGAIVGGNSEKASRGIKAAGRRALFLAFGLPLLASAYTGALTMAADGVGLVYDASAGTVKDKEMGEVLDAGSTVVLSTLVDFENWAANTHLAMPSEVTIVTDHSDNKAGSVDKARTDPVRRIARAVNAASSAAAGPKGEPASRQLHVASMLARFTASATYDAGAFESMFKSTMGNGGSGQDRKWLFQDLKDYRKVKKIQDSKAFLGDDAVKDEGRSVNPAFVLTDGHADYLSATTDKGVTTYSSSASAETISKALKADKEHDAGTKYGLSTIGMYNYLNSNFEKSQVKTYSPQRMPSEFSGAHHRSVNIVGTGMLSVLYFVNALASMAALVIVGVGYGLSMLAGIGRRSLSLIVDSVMGAMGSLQAMAKVVGIVIVMIVEVVVTIIAYALMTEVVLFVPSFIESAFWTWMGAAGTMGNAIFGTPATAMPAAAGTSSDAVEAVCLVVSGLVTIGLCITAGRFRRGLVTSVDQVAASLANKLFGNTAVSTAAGAALGGEKKKGSKLASAAGALASGVVGTAGGMMLGKAVEKGLGKTDVGKALGFGEDEKKKDEAAEGAAGGAIEGDAEQHAAPMGDEEGLGAEGGAPAEAAGEDAPGNVVTVGAGGRGAPASSDEEVGRADMEGAPGADTIAAAVDAEGAQTAAEGLSGEAGGDPAGTVAGAPAPADAGAAAPDPGAAAPEPPAPGSEGAAGPAAGGAAPPQPDQGSAPAQGAPAQGAPPAAAQGPAQQPAPGTGQAPARAAGGEGSQWQGGGISVDVSQAPQAPGAAGSPRPTQATQGPAPQVNVGAPASGSPRPPSGWTPQAPRASQGTPPQAPPSASERAMNDRDEVRRTARDPFDGF